jgi:hypothetical protein
MFPAMRADTMEMGLSSSARAEKPAHPEMIKEAKT